MHVKKRDKCNRKEASLALLELTEPVCVEVPPEMHRSVECQTDDSYFDLRYQVRAFEMECQALRSDADQLRSRLASSLLDEESMKDSNKVKFYTGLPNFLAFMSIFNLVMPLAGVSSRDSLTGFQQLLLTFMRLRLNLKGKDLAYRFAVSDSTVSRVFRKWIDIMHVALRPLIKWPDRSELRLTMPLSFREHFLRTAVIIDCTEVAIERAKDLKARAQTWSNYKQNNTVKYLFGITPQDTVSFVSMGWGGRVSDKHLTEQCGILECLKPRDIVLADRGFTIEDSVGLYCAELKIPSFTRGKKQLEFFEVEDTHKIAEVRIHVERVIGNVKKKYTFLLGPIPLSVVSGDGDTNYSIIDRIAVVCCALNNVNESVVPFE